MDRVLMNGSVKASTDVWADPESASRRFFRDLIISASGMTAAGWAFGNARLAAGIALGGGLALLNFRWLAASVRGILAIGSKRVPPGTTMKIALRWIVVALAGYAGYRSGYFSAAGILIGLLAPAPAVLFESLYLAQREVRNAECGMRSWRSGRD
jgi:hypothetical protein